MSDINLHPPRSNDVLDWAYYFVEMRRRIIQESGRDIADDAEVMANWFTTLYFMKENNDKS